MIWASPDLMEVIQNGGPKLVTFVIGQEYSKYLTKQDCLKISPSPN